MKLPVLAAFFAAIISFLGTHTLSLHFSFFDTIPTVQLPGQLLSYDRSLTASAAASVSQTNSLAPGDTTLNPELLGSTTTAQAPAPTPSIAPQPQESDTAALGSTPDARFTALSSRFDSLIGIVGKLAALIPLTQQNQVAQIDQSVAASGNAANPLAALNAINNLANVTISNPTITGLSAGAIPDLSSTYLSTRGGTVSGNLTVNGTISGTIAASSSALTNLTATNLTLPSIQNSILSTNGSGAVGALSIGNGLSLSSNSLTLTFSTTTANIWTALQTFASGFISQASSTVVGNFTTSGHLSVTGSGTSTISNGLTVGGTGLMYDWQTGSVGIGTAAPGISGVDNTTQLALQINRAGGDSVLALNTDSTGRGARVEFGVSPTNAYAEGYVGLASDNTIKFMGGLTHGDPLSFGVNNKEVMRIVGDQYNPLIGNIGIGTTSPYAKFTLTANPYDQSTPSTLFLVSSSTASATTTLFSILNTGKVGIGTTNPSYTLDVSNSSSGYVARITNTGNTAGYGGLKITAGQNSFTASTGMIDFYRPDNTLLGTIAQNSGTSVTYNTTSDRRVKENIATTTLGLAQLMELPVRSFDFINDPTHATTTGFIAQELDQVFPWAVTTNGDNGTVPLGTSTPWSVDYGRITPLIVKAVQDIATISSTFQQNLIAWLGNAGNGIQDFYAEIIHANKLCLSDQGGTSCYTRSQLDTMLASAGKAPTGAPSDTGSAAVSGSATTSHAAAPVIQINGENPAIIRIGTTYSDLGATITGPAADLNLGIVTFLNGKLAPNLTLDTSAAATDTIAYVVTDQNGFTSTSTRTVVIEAAPAQDPVVPKTATTTSATSTAR